MDVGVGISEIVVMPLHDIRICGFESAEERSERIIHRMVVSLTRLTGKRALRRVTQRIRVAQDLLLLSQG